MQKLKHGLGDCEPFEILKVAEMIINLESGKEISFTSDVFPNEQLYDAVLGGIQSAGFVCDLNCGVHRWFCNKRKSEASKVIRGDFRPDVIILTRER